jgi:hypothetical protein
MRALQGALQGVRGIRWNVWRVLTGTILQSKRLRMGRAEDDVSPHRANTVFFVSETGYEYRSGLCHLRAPIRRLYRSWVLIRRGKPRLRLHGIMTATHSALGSSNKPALRKLHLRDSGPVL